MSFGDLLVVLKATNTNQRAAQFVQFLQFSTEPDGPTYFISSLLPDAKLLANYVRRHWTVENQLHWSLDVSFTEDSRRIRVGNGAAIFGHLRRIALSVIKRDTSLPKTSQRAKRLKAGWPVEALEPIIGDN